MKILVPDYYPLFRCIAGKCRHNCCIGWEIDIDDDTHHYYKSVGGDFGVRLRENIEEGECPHFILGEHERCPFLNRENLCDIYIHLGEEHLCSICADHPRFRNYIGGKCEMGLGLSCEAAGELILTREKPCGWIEYGEEDGDADTSEWEEEILAKRKAVIDVIRDRDKSVTERVHELFDDAFLGRGAGEWHEYFDSLERMDEKWDGMLAYLTEENAAWTEGIVPDLMWENLLVYFVNRHTPDAADEWDLDARIGFALLGYAVIRTVCEGEYRRRGELTTGDLVEIARMYSSEIEYSEDNTETVLGEIETLV